LLFSALSKTRCNDRCTRQVEGARQHEARGASRKNAPLAGRGIEADRIKARGRDPVSGITAAGGI